MIKSIQEAADYIEELYSIRKQREAEAAERYNYDFHKNSPNEGRYEWVPLKSSFKKKSINKFESEEKKATIQKPMNLLIRMIPLKKCLVKTKLKMNIITS